MKNLIGLIIIALLISPFPAGAQAPVKIKLQGSTTVTPVAAEAAEILTAEKGWEILVDSQGGSSGGITALAEGFADIAMSSKPVSDEDRAKYPRVDFRAYPIGWDGVALVVSRPVWDGGVRAVTREQMREIYEGRVKNWKELGGPDTRIVFYNKEPGRGTWEVFADWLYDGHKNAPLVNHAEVGANEEARQKVSTHPSAMTQLSFAWAENSDRIKSLAILGAGGDSVAPGLETIRNGQYPLTRPLYLVTNGEAAGPVKEFIDFLLTDRGREIVKKNGYLPLG
jgi:phosphate transport system substrate-binding protein